VEPLQALSTLLSLTAFALLGAGVLKAFQIAADFGEIKEVLRDIRRNTENYPLAGPVEASKPAEPRVRDLDEASYLAALQARVAAEPPQSVLQPEIVTGRAQTARTAALTGREPTGITVSKPADL
jgi:hypothetical protein